MHGCHVELHIDGTVILVVDGERLFRFASMNDLLEQYALTRGEIVGQPGGGPNGELLAAQIAAAAHVASIHLRPRAEKELADDRLVDAIERVRAARAAVSAAPARATSTSRR